MVVVKRCTSLMITAIISVLVLVPSAVSQSFGRKYRCGDRFLNAYSFIKNLTSPNYPNNYSSNTHCVWMISANPPSNVVLLKLIDFDLEISLQSCIYDYVSIYDGNGPTSPRINQLCGQVSNRQFSSTGTFMTVEFDSDGSNNFRGFLFEYTSTNKSDVSRVRNNSSLMATESASYTESPNYPNNYPSNADFQWQITAGLASQVVVLKLLDFELEESSSCTLDSVTILDGISSTSPIIQTLCGLVLNAQFISTGSSMAVMFHSSRFNNSRGFRFEYHSQAKSAIALSANEIAKYITSPDYPNNYPSNTNREWFITAATPSQVIVLKLLNFNLEGSSPDCSYDYVIMYNGNSTQSPIIQKLCGIVLRTQFMSTSNSMTVVFHSDEYSTYQGFKFEYTSQVKSAVCSGVTLTAISTDTSLTSPNYPGLYPSDMDCSWHITTDSESSVVVLELTELTLKSGQTLCTSDYVKIYDGSSTAARLIQVLCGSLHYGSYESSGSDMTVVFHSDGGNSYSNGFRFTYKSQFSSNSLQKSEASYSQNNTGTIIAVVTCGVAVPILLVVLVLCIKRRQALRRLTNTQNRIPNQNSGENSLFIVTLLTNNQRGTPPYFGEHDPQIMLDPPPYSSLTFHGNDGLPAYIPREPGYSTNDLPPPYSCYMPGGTSQGQTPLLNDPGLRKSGASVDSAAEVGAHLNMGFSFNRDDPVRGENESTYVNSTEHTNMVASTVTPCPPSYAAARNPSSPDNAAPSAPPGC